jgi:hypothetical protein
MPDWSALVRERVGSLHLPRATKEEIVSELAAHLEDLYEAQIAGGMDESEAFERALDRASWRGLAKNIERNKRQEEMMNRRSKQIWFPSLVTLALSMGWLMILQESSAQPQMPWNHAGAPLAPYLWWIVTLPFMGAVSGYLAGRAAGPRAARFFAVLFPSVVMLGLWLIILTILVAKGGERPIQWGNFGFGLLLWVVVPGLALLLGAWPFLGIERQDPQLPLLNRRTRTVWLPGLASLAASMAVLLASTRAGLHPFFLARGLANLVVYLPWLLLLPACGAAGAYLSGRAGGERPARAAAGLFPALTLLALGFGLTLARVVVLVEPRWFHASLALSLGVVVPGVALLLGTLPFLKTAKLEKYPAQASHG